MEAQRFWDLYARWYDRLRHLLPYRQLAREVVDALSRSSSPSTILDAGCGTGYALSLLASAFPFAKLTGVERSASMLSVARDRVARSRAWLVRCNLDQALPFDNASFEAAVSTNVLYALSDPAQTLAEIHRVLKPGAPLILVNPWKPEQRHIWFAHVREVMNTRSAQRIAMSMRLLPTFSAIILVNAVIARNARRRTFWFLTATDLCALIERAGFDVESIRDDAYAGTCCFVVARVPAK